MKISEGLENCYGTGVDFQLQNQLEEHPESKYDTVVEIMESILSQGYKPVFSIPRDYLKNTASLSPKKTWIQDKILAGTLGVEPYNPDGNRILCIYNGDPAQINLKPRLTGPQKLFQGVVATLKTIPLADCTLLDTSTGKETSLAELSREDAPQNEQNKESDERAARSAELKSILDNYSPEKLIEFFKKQAKAEYETPLGRGFSKFTIEDHTKKVLIQYQKYFQNEQLPEPANRDFLRVVLALHDLGKMQALQKGDSALQSDFNKQKIDQIMSQYDFSSDQILLAKMLVSFDPVGNVLKSKDPRQAATMAHLRLQQLAKEFKISTDKLYELFKLVYMSDASAYTSDAGFPPMLDEVFQFDQEYQQIYLSEKTEDKLDPLEKLVYG